MRIIMKILLFPLLAVFLLNTVSFMPQDYQISTGIPSESDPAVITSL